MHNINKRLTKNKGGGGGGGGIGAVLYAVCRIHVVLTEVRLHALLHIASVGFGTAFPRSVPSPRTPVSS